MHDLDAFDQLESSFRAGGAAAMLDTLCAQLDTEARHHELFEALKLRLRQRLGLPLFSSAAEELPPGPLRDQLEAGLLDACRVVGGKLLDAGRIRDAWTYLRPIGDLPSLRESLARIEPTEENAGELIELYLQESLDLERGFELLLRYYGTCNTITTYDSSMYGQPRVARAVGAKLLVRHLHEELLHRLREHLRRLGSEDPDESDVRRLLAREPRLMAEGAYHIDTTHLASVTRIARNTLDNESWQLARQLCDYGQQLDASLQYSDAAPFEELYAASDRYFAALLGESSNAHLGYFRERAEGIDPYHETTYVREVYVDLLARCGRVADAWAEAIRLLPAGMQTTGLAPSLLELADHGQLYQPLRQLARERQDRLTFALSLAQSAAAVPPA